LEFGQTFAKFTVSFPKLAGYAGQVFSKEHYSNSADNHNFHHAHATENKTEWIEMCQRIIHMV